MQIHVFDTHINTVHNQYLHFDVLVDDEHIKQVGKFVEDHLKSLGIEATQITTNSCQFCHSEVANPEVQAAIAQRGHYILPLN